LMDAGIPVQVFPVIVHGNFFPYTGPPGIHNKKMPPASPSGEYGNAPVPCGRLIISDYRVPGAQRGFR
jgi:hypothetical protein